MGNSEYGIPYIPLSWLRSQRQLAKRYFESGGTLTDYDLWLWTVRFEIDRLTMQNLWKENNKLRKRLEIALLEIRDDP